MEKLDVEDFLTWDVVRWTVDRPEKEFVNNLVD